MTSLRVTLALMLVMVAVLLAAGCAGQAGDGKLVESGIPSMTLTISPTSGPMNAVVKSNEEMVLALKMYRANLTYPRNKIPENLLQITDPTFPRYLITPEQVRTQLIASRHLIPSDDATKRFNLKNATRQIIGDQVFLTIHVYPNTTTNILDPVVTNISARSEELHGVEAWVDVNNLEKLAELNGVRDMEFVVYAEHSENPVTAP